MITLSADQLAAIHATIRAGGTRDQAATSAGIPRHLLDRHMKPGGQLAGLKVGRRWRPPSPDPTPAEIEARAAEVRARWPAERWLRQGDDALE